MCAATQHRPQTGTRELGPLLCEQVLSELTTKDNGGWSPLMFASCSGSRFVFLAAMQAFIDRGEEGSRVVRQAAETARGGERPHDLWGGRGVVNGIPCLGPLHGAAGGSIVVPAVVAVRRRGRVWTSSAVWLWFHSSIRRCCYVFWGRFKCL